ncbi:ubiquitin carboxyl-terminal hydrolase 48-like [Glandiceps talaboti]
MVPKYQQHKATWKWIESVTPEEVTQKHIEMAYRLDTKTCKLGVCRRNCKGNPRCLVGMGENLWLGEIDDESWHEIEDPNLERRSEDSFVGLKNLGATCYVNTLLQVWFHNEEFRRAMYQWLPQYSPKESKVPQLSLQGEDIAPTTVCGHLQLLFALLEHSHRRYIDPSAFIECLGLDAAQQQDAQEFSKLLMSLLEDMLQQQPNDVVRNIIQQQFCGQYAYVTKCNNCGGISQRSSTFYELDLNIQGHKQLSECLQEFLQEEKLEGANQYLCERCNAKQNATRRIQIHKLPTVLNLQLLRFIFDRQTGRKKKLNTYIQFPEVLDMTPYMANQDSEVLYDLTAVLIHRGPSAYSGHYIAHIRDKQTGIWYKFNDEEIEKMGGKNLKLGSEEDIGDGGPKPPKKPKMTKGYHASRNSYMLVYNTRSTQQVTDDSTADKEDIQISEELQELVIKDNDRFEHWVKEMTEMREINVLSGKARHDEIKQIYSLLLPKEGEYGEWLAIDWIKKWLADTNTVCPAIDNSKLLCRHDNVDPDQVQNAKLISKQAADIIFTKYGGKPRIAETQLCKACVVERCKLLRMKVRLSEDYKAINSLSKNKIDRGFWIGKCSLRSWRRIVLGKLELNGTEDTEENENISKISDKSTEESNKCSGSEDSEEEDLDFNEDILCEHGNLTTDESCRRLVSDEVWSRFQYYFPDASQFTSDTKPCLDCQITDRADEESSERLKKIASEHKTLLSQLYHDRNRPSWFKRDVSILYVVTKHFVEAWRKFIKQPLKSTPVTSINNAMFLCAHHRLMFHPSLTDQQCMDMVCYVWPHEWEVLKSLLTVDYTVEITRITEDEGKTKTFICNPEICEECIALKLSRDEMERREYTEGVIYIRKLTDTEKPNFAMLESLDYEGVDVNDGSFKDNSDPDFTQSNKTKKNGLSVDKQRRRSSRHRRTRGEKQITVSASDTLKELKLKIMNEFSVAPFDQHLIIEDGSYLTRETATLGDLGVTPGDVLYLKVDLPCEDPLFMDEIMKAGAPEEGFKGTGLVRS